MRYVALRKWAGCKGSRHRTGALAVWRCSVPSRWEDRCGDDPVRVCGLLVGVARCHRVGRRRRGGAGGGPTATAGLASSTSLPAAALRGRPGGPLPVPKGGVRRSASKCWTSPAPTARPSTTAWIMPPRWPTRSISPSWPTPSSTNADRGSPTRRSGIGDAETIPGTRARRPPRGGHHRLAHQPSFSARATTIHDPPQGSSPNSEKTSKTTPARPRSTPSAAP